MVRTEGRREVARRVAHDCLSVILSVSYRVQPARHAVLAVGNQESETEGQATLRELERTWGTACVNSSAELGSFDLPWRMLRARQLR